MVKHAGVFVSYILTASVYEWLILQADISGSINLGKSNQYKIYFFISSPSYVILQCQLASVYIVCCSNELLSVG